MSLIGIDAGTSGVKVAAYDEEGILLCHARVATNPVMLQPGWEESDPEVIWNAVIKGLQSIAGQPALRKDKPRTLAISASGDEVFPVNKKGEAIDSCLLSGDLRGGDVECRTLACFKTDEWYCRCGRLPERMDPVNRMIWWREYRPEIFTKASGFWGWHEYLTYRLTGNAVTDRTLASKWLVYDRLHNCWSTEMLSKFNIDRQLLPQTGAWGTTVGVVEPTLADEIGLPHGVIVGMGSYDSACSAMGSGALGSGRLGLVCGSWEVVLVPSDNPDKFDKLYSSNVSIIPYAGNSASAILTISPNGAYIADWATKLLDVPFEALPAALDISGLFPSPVMAVPHLFGTTSLWENGRYSRGALLGLTPVTTRIDIMKSFLEGVAYDLAITMNPMQNMGIPVDTLCASGGGTKSAWWMQLKSDVCGVPVEVSGISEPGTLGAALLAGLAGGVYKSMDEANKVIKYTSQRFEPDSKRKGYHIERIAAYREAIEALIPLNRRLIKE